VERLDQESLKQCLPHRPPFLWLDEVVELTERRVVARKFLSPDLDVFQGHFPGFPVFPGVLQCEAAFQAAAVLLARKQDLPDGAVPVVTRQNNTKFRQLVRPGQTLQVEVELTERLANAFFFTAKVLADGRVATRLEFACSYTTPRPGPPAGQSDSEARASG